MKIMENVRLQEGMKNIRNLKNTINTINTKYIEDYFEKIPLFYGIDKKDMDSVLKCFHVSVRKYSRGMMIFNEGDKAQYIGVVLEGSVQIVRDDYYGNRSIIAVITPVQIFAEVFSCAEVPELPVGVYADTDTVVMLLDGQKLLKSEGSGCKFYDILMRNLLKEIAQKNLLLNQKIELVSKKTTKEKLLAFLLAEAKRRGSNEFIIDYDRQMLADYLGAERSAMSAEIGKLRDEGYIEVNRRYFKILKKPK